MSRVCLEVINLGNPLNCNGVGMPDSYDAAVIPMLDVCAKWMK